MAKEILILKDKFYGGIVRDDKSKVAGALANCEELEIFGNADFIQAEQLVSAETLPASSEVYAYTAGDDDVMYAYGRRTDPTAGTVRLFSVGSGGATNPGDFTTLFTSANTTDLATAVSDFKFFRSGEASNATSLYYIGGASSTWYLRRYNIGAAAEQIWNGTAWAAGSSNASSDLTGLASTFNRPTMKVIFGDLYICHGIYVAKVAGGTDTAATFTEQAFTLPQEWQAVDIIPVGDKAIILCRNRNRLINEAKGFWWDLTSTTQFDDSFNLPMGGPLWIVNHKETIKIACAHNGTLRIFQLTGPFQGAIPIELPNITLPDIGVETDTQPISSPKMVAQKDKILYFGLFKTNKTGLYALGQVDSDKPVALVLAKRFDTSDYSLHKPTAVHIQGPNFYVAFDDNGTADAARCESNNSPTRSSNATLDTVWIDGNESLKDKNLTQVILACKKLSASTVLAVSVATDYDETFTAITRADATNLNTTNAVLGRIIANAFNNKKAFKVRVAFTSSTTNSPRLQSIGLRMTIKDEIASI